MTSRTNAFLIATHLFFIRDSGLIWNEAWQRLLPLLVVVVVVVVALEAVEWNTECEWVNVNDDDYDDC